MRGQSNRFIPACVGNRHGIASGLPINPVHPRVCGEQPAEANAVWVKFGSSPRVWGTADQWLAARLRRRFIPACVGNSASKLVSIVIPAVHPRVCGEQFSA